MDFFKEAEAIRSMTEIKGVSRAKVAKSLGVSESTVSNKLRLLSLSGEERQIIVSEGLSERHARALLPLKDKKSRLIALEKIRLGRLTVAETEAVVELLKPDEEEKDSPITAKTALQELTDFQSYVDRKITLLKSKGIRITKTASSYGRKTYVTIIIEEDC